MNNKYRGGLLNNRNCHGDMVTYLWTLTGNISNQSEIILLYFFIICGQQPFGH